MEKSVGRSAIEDSVELELGMKMLQCSERGIQLFELPFQHVQRLSADLRHARIKMLKLHTE
jgi:hypothetical protein